MVLISGVGGVGRGSTIKMTRGTLSRRVRISLPTLSLAGDESFTLTGKQIKRLKAAIITELLKVPTNFYPPGLFSVSEFEVDLTEGATFKKNDEEQFGLLTLAPVEVKFKGFWLCAKQYSFAEPVVINIEVVIDANEALYVGPGGAVYAVAP